MKIATLTRFLILAVAASLVLSADCFAVTYDEGVSGDLSDSGTAPTSIGTLTNGLNSVLGTMGGSPVDRDIFTFTVPAGDSLTGISLSAFNVTTGAAGGGSFFSVDDSNTIGAPNAAGSFGFVIEDTPGPLFASSLPAGAGDYTVWVQETAGGVIDYQLDFTTVPEPSSFLMLGLLSCVCVFWKRKQRNA